MIKEDNKLCCGHFATSLSAAKSYGLNRSVQEDKVENQSNTTSKDQSNRYEEHRS